MIDTFDPQGCLAHEGEYLNEIADGEILDLRDSGEAADLVNNVRRARLEVHRLVRYALIILDQERSKGNEDLIVNDSSNVTALIPDGQVKFPHPWPPQIPPGRTGQIMTTRG